MVLISIVLSLLRVVGIVGLDVILGTSVIFCVYQNLAVGPAVVVEMDLLVVVIVGLLVDVVVDLLVDVVVGLIVVLLVVMGLARVLG